MDKLLIGLAGEYFVAGMLNMKGYVASLTLKNYPSVDIFALNPNTGKTINLQVKTTNKVKADYHVGLTHDKIDRIHDKIKSNFVFVHLLPDENVDYYIVPRNDLINIIKQTDDDYFNMPRTKPIKPNYPITLKLKHIIQYKDKWNNIWK